MDIGQVHIFADRDEVEVHKHAKKERNCKLTLKFGTKIKEYFVTCDVIGFIVFY